MPRNAYTTLTAWCVKNATAEVDEFVLLHTDYLYIQDESTNSISRELKDFRRGLDAELIERIGRMFGREAAFKINGCL